MSPIPPKGGVAIVPPRARSVSYGWAAAAIILAGALTRIAGSRGDLWLDEIWSWVFATTAAGPLDIFTEFPSDNNHLLNTLWLYAIRNGPNEGVFRALAIVGGVVAVVFALLWGRRQRPAAGLWVATVVAGSYLLTLYSSEARGYGPLIGCAFTGLYTVDCYRAKPRWTLAGLFWLTAMLGFLAHLGFLHAYAGFLIWSAWPSNPNRGWGTWARDLLRLHAVPLVFLAALYVVFIRHVLIGGGEPYRLADVLAAACSLSIGGPAEGVGVWPVALVALGLLIAALVVLARTRGDLALFFLVVVVVAPGLLLAVRHPRALYVRYLLVNIAFFQLLLGLALATLARRGRIGAVAAGILLVGGLAANARHTAELLRVGRGSYRAAVQYLAAHSVGAAIVVGSDHDFRNRLVLEYYGHTLPPEKRLRYVDAEHWPPEGSEWFFRHSSSADYVASRGLQINGIHYAIIDEYPSIGESGWRWFLYRRSAGQRPSQG